MSVLINILLIAYLVHLGRSIIDWIAGKKEIESEKVRREVINITQGQEVAQSHPALNIKIFVKPEQLKGMVKHLIYANVSVNTDHQCRSFPEMLKALRYGDGLTEKEVKIVTALYTNIVPGVWID